jgi:galactokinase
MTEEDLLHAAGQVLAGELHKRFRHVVTESRRVDDAHRAMLDADIVEFGAIMLESHSSLRDDYEVSSDSLDRLVDISMSAGAHGARLTGAGLGGCVVALAGAATAQHVVGALAQQFYAQRRFSGRLEDQVFVVHPSGGATVCEVN